MKRLAIVSTYDDLCGLAGYTKALVRQLSDTFDVTVFDLDQFLFRNEGKRGQQLADEEIERICAELPSFDYVNIQLEHGTFGRKSSDIVKRVRKIIHASKNIAITFHTINKPAKSISSIFLSRKTFTSPIATWNDFASTLRENHLDQGIFSELRSAQNRKPVSVVVHTRRDARSIQIMQRIKRVFAHPLAFYSQAESEALREKRVGNGIRGRFDLKEGSVMLGCFGFIGEYKGLDTAVRALRLLPSNYHLAIFGGLHPNEIKPNMHKGESFHQNLIDSIKADDTLATATQDGGVSLKATPAELEAMLKTRHPDNLVNRIHFGGALSDEQFAEAMLACDTVLLPYLEVGQASSGPMSIACDLRCHLIASRTKAFMQFSRFNPNRFSMFDVGNHIELAQLIKHETECKPPPWPAQEFTTKTNIETYLTAFGLYKEQTQ
jgi:glycosyltransferase involved in cell wall biosynthesis